MNIKHSLSIAGAVALSLSAVLLTGCPSGEAVSEQKSASAQDKPSGEVWTEDIDGAFKAAADSGKPVFIDFTGSDWCGWCKIADKNIFSTPEWADFAKEVVCLKVDFPQKTRPDVMTMTKREQFAKTFGVQGFPTLVLASAERKALAQFSAGRKEAKEFISEVRKALPSAK